MQNVKQQECGQVGQSCKLHDSGLAVGPSSFPILAKFGPVTDSEVEVMLEESSEVMAETILAQRTAKDWPLTVEQAEYLGKAMINDADRVAEGMSPAAGRAFEAAGVKLLAKARSFKAR